MARVRSFNPSIQGIGRHRTEVDCEHTVVDTGPDRVLHLTTFGSDSRRSERKSSQSIQLDVNMARELVEIILEAFPEIRRP